MRAQWKEATRTKAGGGAGEAYTPSSSRLASLVTSLMHRAVLAWRRLGEKVGRHAAPALQKNNTSKTANFGRRPSWLAPPPRRHAASVRHASPDTHVSQLTTLQSGRAVSRTACRTELEDTKKMRGRRGVSGGVPLCTCGRAAGVFAGTRPPPARAFDRGAAATVSKARGMGWERGGSLAAHTNNHFDSPRARRQQVRAHARQHGGQGGVVVHGL